MKTVNVPVTVGEYAGFKMAVSFDSFKPMPKQLAEAQTKLENVERLAALNALLNMDEKGDGAIGMDDEPGEESGERETSDQQAGRLWRAAEVSR